MKIKIQIIIFLQCLFDLGNSFILEKIDHICVCKFIIGLKIGRWIGKHPQRKVRAWCFILIDNESFIIVDMTSMSEVAKIGPINEKNAEKDIQNRNFHGNKILFKSNC